MRGAPYHIGNANLTPKTTIYEYNFLLLNKTLQENIYKASIKFRRKIHLRFKTMYNLFKLQVIENANEMKRHLKLKIFVHKSHLLMEQVNYIIYLEGWL